MATVALKTRFDADGKLQSKIGGINRGMKDFRRQLTGAKQDAARSRASIDGLNRSLSSTHQLLGRAAGALGLYFGARAIGQALQYGAALGDAREQAEGLLRAQGTTADRVLPKLRASTRRMVSDMELLKLTAQGLTAGLKPADLELLGRASSAMANRTGETIASTFAELQAGLVKGSRGALASLGITTQNLEGLTVPEKIARYRGELERVAALAPSDSVVDKWEKFTTTLTNIRDRFAEAVTNSPAIMGWLEKLNSYFDEDRVNRWVAAVANFFDNFTLSKFLSNIELELAKFLRTPGGQALAMILGTSGGALAGARVGAMFGGPGLVTGGLIGGGAAAITAGAALALDPIRQKTDELLAAWHQQPGGVTAAGLRDKYSPAWLLALRDEVEAMAQDRKLGRGLAPLYGTLVDAYELTRAAGVTSTTPGGKIPPGAGGDAAGRKAVIGGDLFYRYGAGLRRPLEFPGMGMDYLDRSRAAAGLPPLGEKGYEPGKLYQLRPEVNRQREKGLDLTKAQDMAAAAAQNLATSFYNLDFSARSVAQSLGSVLAGAGTQRLGDVIGGKFKGGILAGLGGAVAMLGVGTLLSSLFGQGQEKQTRYLEAIARNTDRSAELLQKALGTPEGFARPTLGRPSYAGLSALAVADSRR